MINLNKKQLEAVYDNQREIDKLLRLKAQYESELRPSSQSTIDVNTQPLMVKEFRFNHVIGEKILQIDDRVKQLAQLNNQVYRFINSLPSPDKNILDDLYIKRMPRQQCAHKYYCDVRTLTRTVDRILQEHYPYQLVL